MFHPAVWGGTKTTVCMSENSVLMYGLYSRAACNQERLMMARVRYLAIPPTHTANVYTQMTDKLLFLYVIITHENM